MSPRRRPSVPGRDASREPTASHGIHGPGRREIRPGASCRFLPSAGYKSSDRPPTPTDGPPRSYGPPRCPELLGKPVSLHRLFSRISLSASALWPRQRPGSQLAPSASPPFLPGRPPRQEAVARQLLVAIVEGEMKQPRVQRREVPPRARRRRETFSGSSPAGFPLYGAAAAEGARLTAY